MLPGVLCAPLVDAVPTMSENQKSGFLVCFPHFPMLVDLELRSKALKPAKGTTNAVLSLLIV
jgi:hypothetical protein